MYFWQCSVVFFPPASRAINPTRAVKGEVQKVGLPESWKYPGRKTKLKMQAEKKIKKITTTN